MEEDDDQTVVEDYFAQEGPDRPLGTKGTNIFSFGQFVFSSFFFLFFSSWATLVILPSLAPLTPLTSKPTTSRQSSFKRFITLGPKMAVAQNQTGGANRGFWSMFPFWYRFFEPQPNVSDANVSPGTPAKAQCSAPGNPRPDPSSSRFASQRTWNPKVNLLGP